jgi:hypothetical protein
MGSGATGVDLALSNQSDMTTAGVEAGCVEVVEAAMEDWAVVSFSAIGVINSVVYFATRDCAVASDCS